MERALVTVTGDTEEVPHRRIERGGEQRPGRGEGRGREGREGAKRGMRSSVGVLGRRAFSLLAVLVSGKNKKGGERERRREKPHQLELGRSREGACSLPL
jgi:hypothetical protein